VCSARAAGTQEDAAQQQLPPSPPMTIEQMFLIQTQVVQAKWSDLSSDAEGAATATPTSTSGASPDATSAQRQAGRIQEGPSPCLCPFC
jgi:hypothetical protein